MHIHSDRDRSHLSSEEKASDKNKDLHSHRMVERGERNELKMFQRRDRRRDEEKLYNRDGSRPGSKSWRDSDVSERSSAKDDTRRSGSPGYEIKKKLKDCSETSNRSWREQESFERRYSDRSPREREEHSSWHNSRGSSWHVSYRDRDDHYSWKDRAHGHRGDHNRPHRDHQDLVHSGNKDWSSRSYSQYRDYDKGDWRSDAKAGHVKTRSVNAGEGHCSERSLGSAAECSRATFTGGEHDRDGQSLAKSGYLEKGGLGNAIQSDGMPSGNSHSQGRSSSSLLEGGCSESLSAHPGGDSRSLPKLKLKVGGISHNIQPDKRQSEGGDSMDRTPQECGPTVKKRSTSAPEPNRRRQRLILQEDTDDDEDDLPPTTIQESAPLRSEEDGFLAYLADEPGRCRRSEGTHYNNQSMQAVRKSSRIPKKRVFDDGDYDGEVEPKKRKKKKVEVDSDEDLYRIEEDEVEHSIVEEEEMELFNDSKLKFNRKKRRNLDTNSPGVGEGEDRRAVLNEPKNGVPLTARQRALQSSKDGLADVGASIVDFPEGLTHSSSKKPKEVLSAAERQLKKEEAAQKRRQQVEKAEKEIQAVAIQKILCQDSQRKKREGKLQKQREDMEQEKKAAAMAPAINSIRWSFGPNGTVVSFSEDVELPKVFSGPLSYPGERERCAGPSCNNAYKYRDSKTLLPLCSLQCYKAVQKKPSEAALAH